MSFILDALKKLEREKAAKKNGNINISEGILRDDHRLGRKGKRPLALLAVASLALVLVVGGVVAASLFWKRAPVAREARKPASAPEFRRDVTAFPEPPSLPAGAGPLPDVQAIAPKPPPTDPGQEKGAGGASVASVVAEDSGDGSTEYCRGGSPSSGSDLKVSGIAWQEKRSARRAVINDVLMPEGAVVGSFTVKEIFQNRVCFQSGGRTYVVSISGPVIGNTPPPPIPSSPPPPRSSRQAQMRSNRAAMMVDRSQQRRPGNQ